MSRMIMDEQTSEQPMLSVVVTIVDGGDVLRRCLQSLVTQVPPSPMEVLVPYDFVCPEAGEMVAEYPDFKFIDISEVFGGRRPGNHLELHRFYDVRRAEALKRCRAPLIAIIEDRGIPLADWSSQMIKLHAEFPHGIIGGAVENGVDRLWNWATFFCDFGRYQHPLEVEQPEYVTDTNICYKRDVIERSRSLWEQRYIEAELHWAIAREGGRLMLSDRARTRQLRPPTSTMNRVRERFHWGRMFGLVRGGDQRGIARLKYIIGTPLLPMVLYWRHFNRQRRKGHHVRQFLLATPLTIFLLACWSLGELVGYLQARGSA